MSPLRSRAAHTLAAAVALCCACGSDPAGGARTGAPQAGSGAPPGAGTGAAPGCTGAECAPPPGAPADCSRPSSGPRILRRLSHFEYDRSIEDLLGMQAGASERFAADTVVAGFDNNASALVVTPLLGDQLYASAERLAAEAMKNPSRLAPCVASQRDMACVQTVIAQFGRRVFRRPLTDKEKERYLTLYTVGQEGADFSAGLELVLTALLQSPNFLYRPELGEPSSGGAYALTPFELATELAYTLTGSTPDDALLDAAERGQLATDAQLQAQAERLIDSPRGKQQLVRFVREWLDVVRLSSVPKDAALFPEWNADIRGAMGIELERFVTEVAFGSGAQAGTLSALLSTPLAFVNDRLAQFYGLPLPAMRDAQGFGAVAMPEPERRGLLTLGAVMTTHARPDSSSPVHRGKLIRERVLCQNLLPPPPGIVVQPPPVDPSLSVRERYAAHSANGTCQNCHKLIDPIGFGFEHFDGVGRYRERDADRPVDASGQIIQSDSTDGTFMGAADLTAMLAESEEVERCFATQWMRFAYGLPEQQQLECARDELGDDFVEQGGSIRDLLLHTTRIAHFRTRLGAADDPPPGAMEEEDPFMPAPGGMAGTGAPPPTMDPNLTVMVHTDSSWAGGRCDRVTVHNNGSQSLTWSITLEVTGTIGDKWNVTASALTGQVTFTGADWNKSVMPGQSVEFGYCVKL